MKIFVCGSFLNKKEVRIVEDTLRKEGYEITSHWVEHEGSEDPNVLEEQSLVDEFGIREAHVVVVVWPGRNSTTSEIGIAIGCGKPVFIRNGKDLHYLDNLYYNHPLVHIVFDMEELKIRLRYEQDSKTFDYRDNYRV